MEQSGNFRVPTANSPNTCETPLFFLSTGYLFSRAFERMGDSSNALKPACQFDNFQVTL
jgi:hypothetical protein